MNSDHDAVISSIEQHRLNGTVQAINEWDDEASMNVRRHGDNEQLSITKVSEPGKTVDKNSGQRLRSPTKWPT